MEPYLLADGLRRVSLSTNVGGATLNPSAGGTIAAEASWLRDICYKQKD